MDGLGRRVLVAAFDGWNDAGDAASSAITQLREGGSYETVFSVDPELYFDYQYTRSHTRRGRRRTSDRSLAEACSSSPARATRGDAAWLAHGHEPARA